MCCMLQAWKLPSVLSVCVGCRLVEAVVLYRLVWLALRLSPHANCLCRVLHAWRHCPPGMSV
jgi:hypothetical protein